MIECKAGEGWEEEDVKDDELTRAIRDVKDDELTSAIRDVANTNSHPVNVTASEMTDFDIKAKKELKEVC